MLTIETLRQFGANTEEGLRRCVNNETFYLRLVNMALDDQGYERLAAAVENGETRAAFEAAHALKGSLGNLSLSPLFTPVSELTELLRGGEPADCSALLQEILSKREELLALRED